MQTEENLIPFHPTNLTGKRVLALGPAPGEAVPLVSVIVRTKDRPSLLANALKSIAQQTYANLEIVVVNDGGQDVRDMVNALAGNIPVVYIHHEKNKGRSAAANAGLDHAQGVHLIFLDDDDWFEPNHISSLVAALEKEPQAKVAYTGVRGIFNTNDDKPGDELFFNQPFDPVQLLGGNYIPIHASLFHRSLLRSGCRFDENLEVYEDWDFWLQLSRFTRFIHLDQITAVYRASHNSGVGLWTDENKVRRGKEAIYEKWGKIWSGEEINALMTQSERARKSLAEEVESSKKLLSVQAEEIRAKDDVIKGQAEEIRAKDGVIKWQAEEIRAKDDVIKGQAEEIRAKDTHIHNLESELIIIKHSRAWRMAEFFRHLFYIKLLGKFPLLQKGMLTISMEGMPAFFARTKRYLRKNKHVATMGLIESDYDKWIKKNQLTDEMIGEIKRDIAGFQYRPEISIIMPVYNVDQVWLEKAIDSVINQPYENWELCIADDASTKKHIKQVLERYSKKDNRIRVRYLEENQGIAGASNEALSLATGEFIGLLDNDDELRIDAIYEYVKLLNKNPEADLIYSDEDKIDTHGNRMEPFFKPDYSPDFLLTNNYICHFSLFRRSIINSIGGFRKGYDGSQDYDLILRFIEKTKPERIFHIPKILYHWRKIPGSAAMIADAKSYAFVSAKKALSDYLRRNSMQGKVVDGNFIGSYRIKREIKNDYKVSIIIPFKDQSKVLRTCINSIIGRTKYREYEIVLVNNQSEKEETFEYLDEIKDNSSFRILAYDEPFNFSAINNYAVSQVDSEYIVLLNNDTEVISPDWIETMLEFAQREDVGAVGALLYYPNDTVQHGGVILGMKGVAGHSHIGLSKDSMGYFGRLKTIQNLSAVTAACLMSKKTIYNEVGGFDENFSHAFNDVDFCLKLRQKGYLIVYTPYAELYHHESLSRGYEDTPEKQARFRKEIELFQGKWKDILTKGDPYYNPNLTLDREDFSIRI